MNHESRLLRTRALLFARPFVVQVPCCAHAQNSGPQVEIMCAASRAIPEGPTAHGMVLHTASQSDVQGWQANLMWSSDTKMGGSTIPFCQSSPQKGKWNPK